MLFITTISYSSAKTAIKCSNFETNLIFDEGVKIKLILNGKTYELQAYNLTYVRDDHNKSDGPFLGSSYQKSSINLTLRSSKIDQELLNWILSAQQDAKDGQIIVTDGDNGKTTKTVTFTGANTASYNENNNTNNFGGNLQFTNFSLSFKTIAVKY